MTAGHGICHAEVSPDGCARALHGVQLWVCLPDAVRDSTPRRPSRTWPTCRRTTSRGVARPVLVGSLAGVTSPAPALHAAGRAPRCASSRGRAATLPLGRGLRARRARRRRGPVEVDGQPTCRARDELPRVPDRVADAPSARGDGRRSLMLLGGEPFEEEIVMWWNFIGRSHEEIVEQREAWNGAGVDDVPPRFGDGPRLRRRPAAGAADAEHPAASPRGRSAAEAAELDAACAIAENCGVNVAPEPDVRTMEITTAHHA